MKGESRAAEEITSWAGVEVFYHVTPVSGWDGSLWECASLGPGD